MKAAIGITTYSPPNHPNGSSFTERLRVCLPSVAKLREYGHEISVVVVDDGSGFESEHCNVLKSLCRQHMFEYALYSENYGVAEAKNSCLRVLRWEQFDIGFLLDDDVEVTGDLIGFYDQRMAQTNVSHAAYWHTDFSWIRHEYGTLAGAPIVMPEHTLGVCLAFRPEMLTQVGAFRVFPHKAGWEHVDWTARAVRAGLCPAPMDFVGSDRYLRIQATNRISTNTADRAERIRMSDENKQFMMQCSDVFLPL